MFHTDIHLLARVAMACAIAFAFGFDRQLRGSPAGNRAFVRIGGTAAGVTPAAAVFAAPTAGRPPRLPTAGPVNR